MSSGLPATNAARLSIGTKAAGKEGSLQTTTTHQAPPNQTVRKEVVDYGSEQTAGAAVCIPRTQTDPDLYTTALEEEILDEPSSRPSLADYGTEAVEYVEASGPEYHAAELVLMPAVGLDVNATTEPSPNSELDPQNLVGLGSAFTAESTPPLAAQLQGLPVESQLETQQKQEPHKPLSSELMDVSTLNGTTTISPQQLYQALDTPELRHRHRPSPAQGLEGSRATAEDPPHRNITSNESSILSANPADAPSREAFQVDTSEGSTEGNALPPLTLPQITAFAVPALGAVLADPLMSLVDTACVGQVSSIGLAALGPNTTIFMFVGMIFMFLTTATTALVARAFDKGERKEVGRAVSDALTIAVTLGPLMSFIMITQSTPLFSLLNTSMELMKPAQDYLFWRALSLPCTLVSFVGTAACLGQRDSSTPLKVAGLSGLVNLVVDLFLVLGPLKMGIVGAAMATAGSQLMAATLYVIKLRSRMELRPRMLTWARVQPFVSAASVLILRSTFIMSVFMMMTGRAASMGTLSVAAHQVLIGVLTVAQFCPEPMSSAAQTFLASTAGPVRRGTATPKEAAFARQAGRLLLRTSATLGCGLAAGAFCIARFAPGLFTSDPLVMARVATLAPFLGAAILVYTLVCQMDGLLFAAADLRFSAAMQFINLPAMIILLKLTETHALAGIWCAFAVWNGVRFLENGLRVLPHYK
eukprot:CAMPEP_0118933290 /NCGR_PEP_ID=MMETSP1169-20130426/11899_1 /TAXON_ID=36882 /ORGANISM="Pyramimonas obovata, Strain CCMP722" /LENGTH=701 /DNA_ID=CAMNT_0006876031 /DNA_START=237 /DNA_END=2342 /DNA_ORIENTATION=-